MIYNFDEIINRENTQAVKYDDREKIFGTGNVIPLWVADMEFETAKPIRDAIEKRAKHGIYGYVSKPGSYFDAFCKWQKRRNNWEVDPELVSFGTGVVPSLSSIVKEFTSEKSKILIQTPVYPQFYGIIEAWGREVLDNPLVEIDGTYNIDFIDFEEKLKMKPEIFILCNPQNPVGRVWKKQELVKMADLCIKYNVLIVSDEIHSDFMLWGNKHIPTASLSKGISDNTITCSSCTKTFNLAGLQASFTVFPNKKLKNTYDSFWQKLDIHRNNCFSIVAMEAAYNEGEEWLEQLLPYIEGNLNFVHDYCEKYIPKIKANIPESTYLIWLDCRNLGLDDDQLNELMIKKAHLGLNRGNAFSRGLTGFMRLNAACPRSTLEHAMKQLRQTFGDGSFN